MKNDSGRLTDMDTVIPAYQILLARKDGVERGLLALQKRAQKKGLPPLTWSWGKVTVEEEVVPSSDGDGVGAQRGLRRVTRVALILVGSDLCLSGWTFVAVLQHLDGENIVRAVGSAEVPVEYRTRGPICDHCRQNRRRNDTYVVRHESGRYAQVGSTCINDFLGSGEASELAARAELLACARDLAQGGESGLGCGGSSSSSFALQQYLPFVAWEVRALGWVSRTTAKERGNIATADHALRCMDDDAFRAKVGADPTEEDLALATAAEQWADALTDVEVNAERGDYLHNLRAVARTGLGTARTAGIAASMITAYQRHLAAERLRAERAALPKSDTHVGTVGERTAFLATLEFVTGYESAYGYTTVLRFRTDDGALLVWKASSTTLGRADAGKRYVLTGTVKKHDEYKDQKQTLLTRCTLVERPKDDTSPIVQPPAKKAKKSKAAVPAKVEAPARRAQETGKEYVDRMESKSGPEFVTRENFDAHRATHDPSNSWWENDARGIPLCRVCEQCRDVALSAYRPEVLGEGPGRYEDVVEEPIEPN